jgi:L-fucose isomerase-like protein
MVYIGLKMQMRRQHMRNMRAGFVGFGEVNTPRDLIEKKCGEAMKLLEDRGIELVSTEPVSDDPAGQDVERAVMELSRERFDFLILCVAGWIPSHAVINVADAFSHKPMLLWGLSGSTKDGVLVTTADQAGTSALRKAFEDMGYRFKYIYESIGAPPKIEKVVNFGNAARAAELLKHSKMGMMGFRDMNLYTTLYDGVSLKKTVGPEVEVFEMYEVVQLSKQVGQGDIQRVMEKIKKQWIFEKTPADDLLEKGIRLYLALDAKVRERGYQAVSLIDVWGMKKLLNYPPAMIFMLLSDESEVTTIPENDILGGITQLIVRYLTGQSAAYMEFYEFMTDRVLMGVPDFVPSGVVEGKVRVIPTQFGELSTGLLNVSRVKTGRVTLCRLTSSGDRYAMHILTGEALQPRRWEEAGWEPPAPQLPSLEVVLDTPVEDFAQKVMSQHYIISYGDHVEIIKDLSNLLGIQVIE